MIITKEVIEDIKRALRDVGLFGLQNVMNQLYNDHIELENIRSGVGQITVCVPPDIDPEAMSAIADLMKSIERVLRCQKL